VRRFAAELPGEWVFRAKDSDYGIDAEVELFEPMPSSPRDAQATGILFDVQSKGTDDTVEGGALAVRFNVSTLNYLAAMDRPVLIVRYITSTGRLYVRWFHTYDPGYLRDDRLTVTLHLDTSDVWMERTPKRLAEEATAYHRLRSSSLDLPLVFRVELGEGLQGTGGLTLPEFVLELQSLREAAPLIRYSTTSSSPTGLALRLTEHHIRADLAGVTTATLLFGNEQAGSRLRYDGVVAIALALDSAGRAAEASRLVLLAVEQSSFLNNVEVCIRLGSILHRSHRLADALRLARRLWERLDVSEDSADAFIWPAFVESPAMDDEQRREFSATSEARLAGSTARGDASRAAGAAYSLANLLLGEHRLQPALQHYRLAASLDASYLNRPYYWQEVGGLLFLGGRHKLSVDAYARCLATGSTDPLVRALYADALLYAGRYADAERAWAKDSRQRNVGKALYSLKRTFADYLVRQLSIQFQRRQPSLANRMVREAVSSGGYDLSEKGCRMALDADALCGNAWYNLGMAYNDRGTATGDAAWFARAEFCFRAAALLVEDDLDAWVLASTLEIALGSATFPTTFEAGYRVHGGTYIGRLLITQRAIGADPKQVADLADQLERLRSSLQEEPALATIRMASGREYAELVFGTVID
jgi:tetratricopeptide (TPR) repeat protein